MAKTGATGIVRIINAGKYSLKGLKAGLVNEAAFRQEAVLGLIMIIAAVFLARENSQFNVLYYSVLISGPFLVMTFEIINSAIEAVVDRIGNEYHELSGRAKDMGSAAVFIMLMYTLITWILVLLHLYTGII
jgi:diacylglycerol kinase (ATP)